MDASILIVGSEKFSVELLKHAQTTVNCNVQLALDAVEVLSLIKSQPPDLLILQASHSNEAELCQQIKQMKGFRYLYCLLIEDQPALSSSTEYAARAQALERGADAYLWLPHLPQAGAEASPESHLEQQLLTAQIRAGLRIIESHRELMRTNDVLSTMALIDPLTSLNNRRALEWELPRQVQNARNRGLPLSIIILDVDFFKSINDTYGHLVGDCALKLLSERLQGNLRFQDTLFRYGGEEFVVILSNTNCEEGLLVAHRLRRLVSDQGFVVNNTLTLNLTISAGTTSLDSQDDDRGLSLLQRADQNLLQAKSSGRNRVVSCELPDPCSRAGDASFGAT